MSGDELPDENFFAQESENALQLLARCVSDLACGEKLTVNQQVDLLALMRKGR